MVRQRPALELAQDMPGGGRLVAADRRVMVRFTDGTWCLVTIVVWQKDEHGRWCCLIRWHVTGKPYEGWFVHDAALISRLDPLSAGPHPGHIQGAGHTRGTRRASPLRRHQF